MKMTATEFKAKCLAVIDRVHAHGEPVTITKRGRVVAKLVADADTDEKPWLRLRAKAARWKGDPFAPVVSERDIQALK
jgi:prevent-host-death family protein